VTCRPDAEFDATLRELERALNAFSTKHGATYLLLVGCDDHAHLLRATSPDVSGDDADHNQAFRRDKSLCHQFVTVGPQRTLPNVVEPLS
jgi:hypothetical protein